MLSAFLPLWRWRPRRGGQSRWPRCSSFLSAEGAFPFRGTLWSHWDTQLAGISWRRLHWFPKRATHSQLILIWQKITRVKMLRWLHTWLVYDVLSTSLSESLKSFHETKSGDSQFCVSNTPDSNERFVRGWGLLVLGAGTFRLGLLQHNEQHVYTTSTPNAQVSLNYTWR